MTRTLLVANRGEVALRILRTARALGWRTLAVYSDADAGLPHVAAADVALRLGPAPARDSYLNIEALLALAVGNGADALHPGYGFLAENPALAAACEARGVTFVGPASHVLALAGDKAAARRTVAAAEVPVVPGHESADAEDDEALAAAAADLGYPVLIKALAGGGGRGIRRVEDSDAFADALASARREATAAFGDGRVLLERAVAAARHVEVQVLADAHGTVLHLGERECSIQRRHQKLVEEAPSPALTPPLREAMTAAAVRAARAVGLVGAGTVEFLLEPATGAFYFMEMNPRLQVEHPVTEQVLGVDLVQWQLAIAAGEALTLRQEALQPRGHAIECRLLAEDPDQGDLPATGTLTEWTLPEGPGLRVDAGYAQGTAVPPDYDSLLAKLVAWGEDRAQALARAQALVAGTRVGGLPTNADWLGRILAHEAMGSGRYDTGFLGAHRAALQEEAWPDAMRREVLLALAAVEAQLAVPAAPPPAHVWSRPAQAPVPPVMGTLHRLVHWAGERLTLQATPRPTAAGWRVEATLDGTAQAVDMTVPEPGTLVLHLDGLRLTVHWAAWGDQRRLSLRGRHALLTVHPARAVRAGPAADAAAGQLTAPLPGRIVQVHVAAEAAVPEGTVLATLEAMKVEHPLTAPVALRVTAVHQAPGDRVDKGAVVLHFEPHPEDASRGPQPAGDRPLHSGKGK